MRRLFLCLLCLCVASRNLAAERKPNILVVIADQWREQAFGFAGDPNVKTPNLDALARVSVRCVNAVSGMPVCSPTRASYLTGQRPLTHGVFINDVPLDPNAVTRALGFSSDKVHAKHPFLYFVLAVLSLIWLRFQSTAPAR